MPVLHDANRVNLRKAVRATIVVPLVFAPFVVAGNAAAALFGSFGAFAALVFADFGGPLPRRFRAYAGLAVVGATLVALGSAFADDTWLAFAVTVAVVFGIVFAGALGGYFAAGGTAATLAYVLAVMTPGVDSDLASRELGWILGVGIAAVAAVVLWPVHQRDRVRLAAAAVLAATARCLAEPAADRDLAALQAADGELAARAGVVYRPAGSIARERALVALVVVARRLLVLTEAVTRAERSPVADTTVEYRALAASVAVSLRASAQMVDDRHVDDRHVDEVNNDVGEAGALVSARSAHTGALERWAGHTLAGDQPGGGAERVVEGVTAAFPLRRLSLASMQIADHAAELLHDRSTSRLDRAAFARAVETLRAHCTLRSVRFRNAARAGVGLAIAVVVAKTTSVEHAFWVVLGALAVLRSSALGTGATALQALTGALIGFGAASALMATVGGDDIWLWIALPVVVFLAAYTPGAVNFVVGQAGFTVFVVVMFNVLTPEGWRTGLVRVQDVAIGAGISIVVGALLWPRGARGVARHAFAELLRAGAALLTSALTSSLRGDADSDVEGAAVDLVDARARAVAALEDLALERGGGHVDREGWGGLLVEALLIQVASDGLVRGRSRHGLPDCTDAIAAMADEGDAVVAMVEREAAEVERVREPGPTTAAAMPPLPSEVVQCLEHHGDLDLDLDRALDRALGLVWAHEWLGLVAHRPV